jgi:tetratricopeptide (TPR) repeat protein
MARQSFDSYKEIAIHALYENIKKLAQHKDNPAQLTTRLPHLLSGLDYCKPSPEFIQVRLHLINTLRHIPFHYSFGDEWVHIIRTALAELPTEHATPHHLALLNLLIAKHAYDRVDKATAIEHGNLAFNFAQHAEDGDLVAEAAQILSRTYIYHYGEHQQALQTIKQAQTLSRSLTASPAQTIRLYLSEGDALRRLGNLKQARELLEIYGEQGLSLSLSDREHAIILLNRGLIRQADGDYVNAADDLGRAASLYVEIKEFSSASGAYGDLGLCLWGWGELELAELVYLHALELAVESGDIQREMKLHGNLGLVYISQGRFDEAETRICTHLRQAESLTSTREANRARGNLAQLWTYRGDPPERTLGYLEDSLKNHKTPNEGRGNDLALRAICRYRMGNLDLAQADIIEAFEICSHKEHSLLPIITHRAAAECATNTNNAIYHLQEALHLSETYHRRLDEAGCLLKLAELCHNEDYHDRAKTLLCQMKAEAWFDYGKFPLLPLMI